MPDRITARMYEFRVTGPIPAGIAQTFCELDTVMIGSQTVLFGNVLDHAHLMNLLNRFRACGLLLTEMRPRPTMW
ncbi:MULTISPECIES: hypothetical protein [Streptomyces]|uniref:hypothetical protein n=1 Tax=Streptomyces TaxID=1883 RepID=UPI001FEBC031|nr:hypothetical protein [Streptomyces glaucescens]